MLGEVFDQGHGDLIVGLLLHDAVGEDEAVLVFADGHAQAKLTATHCR